MELMEVLNEAYDLSNLLHNTQQYKKLLVAEKSLENKQELKDVFVKYHQFQEEYSLYKTEENKEKLFKIKYELDTNPIVKDYNLALKEYNLLLLNIKKIIFHSLINEDDLIFRVFNTLK